MLRLSVLELSSHLVLQHEDLLQKKGKEPFEFKGDDKLTWGTTQPVPDAEHDVLGGAGRFSVPRRSLSKGGEFDKGLPLHPGGSHLEKQKLREDLFANPSHWSDHRLQKREAQHPNFRHKKSRAALSFKNIYKPIWMDDGLATLDAQLKSGLGARQLSSNVKSSTTIHDLRSLCEEGQLNRALDALLQLEQDGKVLSVTMYRSLLKACGKRKALHEAKQVHLHLAQHGLESAKLLGEETVSTLVKCGSLEDALQVFHRLEHRNVFCWTAIISGYTNAGQGRDALRMYHMMLEEDVQPDGFTFVSLLKACCSIACLEEGKQIHAQILKHKFESDLFVGAGLVNMYSKCGSVADAQIVFDGLSNRNVVSWTTMLSAYVQQEKGEKVLKLFEQMCEEGVSADAHTFVTVIQACCTLAEKEESIILGDGQLTKVKSVGNGKAIHAEAWMKGYNSNIFLCSTLISMYGKCGSITDARNVFEKLFEQDVVSWNAMLEAYLEQAKAEKALHLYWQMRDEGVSPNNRTFVTMAQACGMLAEHATHVAGECSEALCKGKAVHGEARRKGYDLDTFVGNTLISMYGKCGSIVDARHVFEWLGQRDVVSWNAMLAAYVEQDQVEEALQLYKLMCKGGVSPNKRTFGSAFQACSMLAEKEEYVDRSSTKLRSLEKGMAIHADARRKGYDSDVFVGNTLITMYGKCGAIGHAQNVFDNLPKRNLVSWNALLAAYVHLGQGDKTLHLYDQVCKEGVRADDVTFLIVLQACSMLIEQEESGVSGKLKALEKGRVIHADAWRSGYKRHGPIGNTLISMYGKCGSIEDARKVFEGLANRTVVSWTAMLAAYAQQGQGQKGLQLYKQMQAEGVSPDDVAYVCILQACSDAGGLDMCKQIHHKLVSTGRHWSLILANTLIHTYGRCASMGDAQVVFDALSQPDVISWTALIAGYAREGKYAISLQTYKQMELLGIEPDRVTFVSLLAACSQVGLVEQGVAYFISMCKDHAITPDIWHYICLIDLLGRAGCFSRIDDLLQTMPIQPNLAMWLCLLGCCRKHGKVVLGKLAFDNAVRVEPQDAAAYVLMRNIYREAGLLDDANLVNDLEIRSGAWEKPSGRCWIEYEQEVNTFIVEEHKNLQQEQFYDLVEQIHSHLVGGHILQM